MDTPDMVYVVLADVDQHRHGRVEAVFVDRIEADTYSTMGDMQVVPCPVTRVGQEARVPE